MIESKIEECNIFNIPSDILHGDQKTKRLVENMIAFLTKNKASNAVVTLFGDGSWTLAFTIEDVMLGEKSTVFSCSIHKGTYEVIFDIALGLHSVLGSSISDRNEEMLKASTNCANYLIQNGRIAYSIYDYTLGMRNSFLHNSDSFSWITAQDFFSYCLETFKKYADDIISIVNYKKKLEDCFGVSRSIVTFGSWLAEKYGFPKSNKDAAWETKIFPLEIKKLAS